MPRFDRLGGVRGRLVAATAVLALAGAAFLLLSGGGGDGGLTPVARAAERTAGLPGAQMEITGELKSASGESFTIGGEGAYNGETGRFRMKLRAGPSAGAQFEIEQRAEQRDGKFVMYMRSKQFGAMLAGAEWMKIDLSEAVGAKSQSFDPRDQLRTLRESGDVKELGTEEVRGVRTTRYGATVDMREEVERLRDEDEDRAADLLEKVIEANGGATESKVDIWIAGDRVHRYRMEIPFNLLGANSTMLVTTDLFDFGAKPQIELPADGEVFDATHLAEQGLEQRSR